LKSGEHLENWAGHEMARRSDGACTHPFVVRLVDWNGAGGEVVLTVPGTIATAAKENMMGEVGDELIAWVHAEWLTPEPAEAPSWARNIEIPGGWSRVRVGMRSNEIATVMLDLVLGRKQWRDLDAKREVWARIHKTGEGTEAQRHGGTKVQASENAS
jgi:hypothetical protein